MRKRWFVGILISMLIIAGCYYLQEGREMDACGSFSSMSGNYHSEWLTVVVNKMYIEDKEECAKEIIRKCRENAFRTVKFSYDYSIPNELRVSVYLSKFAMKKGKPEFEFAFITDAKDNGRYDIVHHPEKFKLLIRDDS